MNYHMIRTNDMLNGDGLRVIIFLSGCKHHCDGCHNPETWDIDSGKKFTKQTLNEILNELNNDYISGLTISGGDPLHEKNVHDVYDLVSEIKQNYPDKSIWLYTGYKWEDIYSYVTTKGMVRPTEFIVVNMINKVRQKIVSLCDVLVDGKFIKSLADVNCPWVGSTNQRVIDVKRSLGSEDICLV